MKESINIEKTILGPKVILDKENEIFAFIGKSGVENADDFYKPVLAWFEDYFKNPNPKTEINFYLEYLNSASSVQLGKLLDLIENSISKSDISINWIYDKDDEIMKETGKEFQYMYGMKFNFKENDEESEDLQF